MSEIKLLNSSCADITADAIVNAANKYLMAGSGICGVIFKKAGLNELEEECSKIKTPLNDGDAVITSSCNMSTCKVIIHAVGPNYHVTPDGDEQLENAYYNSMKVLKENNLHSISFPLISSGIFGGNKENPAANSTEKCISAYNKFTSNDDYDIEVYLCAFTKEEFEEASKVFESFGIKTTIER